MVDRQNKYERYHDAIYSNLKSDMRTLRQTADLFLETSSKGDITQDLKNNLHVVQNALKSVETHLSDVEEESRKNQKAIGQVPTEIDGKVSNSAVALGKEIDMLKEMIGTLREDKKKEVNNLKAEISALREEIKNDVIALKADIKSSRSEFKADTKAAMSMVYYRLLIGVFTTAAMAIAAFQSLGNLAKKEDRGDSNASSRINTSKLA